VGPRKFSIRALVLHSGIRMAEAVRNELALTFPYSIVIVKRISSALWKARIRRSYPDVNWCKNGVPVFVHIPKTGGTSIRSRLNDEYSERNLTLRNYHELWRFLTNYGSGSPPLSVALVHLPISFLTDVGFVDPDCGIPHIVTVVRQPEKRYPSAFADCRRKRLVPRRMSREKIIKHLAMQKRDLTQSYLRDFFPVFLAPMSAYLEGLSEEHLRLVHIDDLDSLLPILGVVARGLNRKNPGSKNDQYLSESDRAGLSGTELALVQKFYAEDYELVLRSL
jgi:hypothetical protein